MKRQKKEFLGLKKLLVGVFFICLWAFTAKALVLHPDSAVPANRPADAVAGRWGSNASCVVVSSQHVLTTTHQGGGVGTTVVIEGVSYTVAAENRFAGSADIRLARIVKPDGSLAELADHVQIYTNTDEVGQTVVLGSYGRGRDPEGTLTYGSTVYGYEWDHLGNAVLRWCENRVDIAYDDPCGINDLLQGDFDGPDVNFLQRGTDGEGIPAEHDSGGGWFYEIGGSWYLFALTRGVTQHPQDSNWPAYGESWFDDPYSGGRNPDSFTGMRVSSYASQIASLIDEPNVPTGLAAVPGPGSGQVTLSWDAVAGASNYRVFYEEDSSGPPYEPVHDGNLPSGSEVGDVNSVVVSGLTRGQSYNFAVTSLANNGITESYYSSPAVGIAASDVLISGYVSEANEPLQGIAVDLLPSGYRDYTDANGRYDFAASYAFSGAVSPNDANFVFSPEVILVDNAEADVNGVDFSSMIVLSDDFDDALRSANWRVNVDDFDSAGVSERGGLLVFESNVPGISGVAEYAGNEWTVSCANDFTMKVLLHCDVNDLTGQGSAEMYFRIGQSDANFVEMLTGEDANGFYRRIELFIAGDSNVVEQVYAADANVSFYVKYSAEVERLSVDIAGYKDSQAWVNLDNVFNGQWDANSVAVSLGGRAVDAVVNQGDAFADDFVINTAVLQGWPPLTDVDGDGFIGWADMALISGQWLLTGVGLASDITQDQLVNFADFGAFAFVW